MAKLKPVPTPPAAAQAPAPQKSSKKLIIIGVAVLLLLMIGGGAGAWFFLQGHHSAEPKVVEKKPPVFVTLEPFTVNLQQEAGDHYLQVGVVYQVEGDKSVDAMKAYMPIIRNRILLVLSGKRPSELSQNDGKQKLISELVTVARESVPAGTTPEKGIEGAFLSAFVIQ